MIRFVDLKSGSTYNGESPYMHYPFGSDGLSCGIPIVGKLCFLSDQGSVNVSLDENPVYSLLDPGVFETAPDETINEFQYKNLEGLKADALALQGVPLDDMYIYMVYILECTYCLSMYIRMSGHTFLQTVNRNRNICCMYVYHNLWLSGRLPP